MGVFEQGTTGQGGSPGGPELGTRDLEEHFTKMGSKLERLGFFFFPPKSVERSSAPSKEKSIRQICLSEYESRFRFHVLR